MKKEANDLQMQLCREAAEKLHHLSMRYVGAVYEVATGKKVGFVASNHPGNSEMRDLIDLVLLTRAEISALTVLLVKKDVFTHSDYVVQVTEEYEFITKVKADQFGVEVVEGGLHFTKDS